MQLPVVIKYSIDFERGFHVSLYLNYVTLPPFPPNKNTVIIIITYKEN